MEMVKGEADGKLPEDLARFRAIKQRAEQIAREEAGSKYRKDKKGGN